ncbi:hypothetical protein ACN47E_003117 [Coniothyrium glycines]
MRFYTTLASAAALFELSIAGYVLQDDYMTDFFGGFNFFTGPDPTEGFVDYVDEATARSTNLINGSSEAAVSWGVDTQNQTPKGRPSVRIESKKKYDSGLIVLDVAHMPFGCGTWPAFWTVGPNWPKNGEIDILEGVNDQTNNGMTLHTGPGCQIGQDTTQFSGTVNSDNCDVAAIDQPKNTGCSIEHPSTKSYGAGLNSNGGGVYATQWTSEAISVYFFPRESIPADVLGDNPDPTGWGKPAAKFSGGCDIESTFAQQQIVFDTTFCGQWAGSQSVWDASSCSKKASTCEEWVRDNPEAFAEAYWTVNALKVYQDNGQASAPESSAAPVQSTVVSKPLPVPTITNSFPTNSPPALASSSQASPTDISVPYVPIAIPSVSDGVLAPISSTQVLSDVPATPTASPVPSNEPSPQQPSATSRKPTQPLVSQPPAPIGANGMPGFQWPIVAGGQPDDSSPSTTATSPSQPTNTPVPNLSSALVAPSTAQNIAIPTAAPVLDPAAPTPTVSSDAPPAIPSVPVVTDTPKAVHTVYETVYATVTVDPAATPAPGAPARKARYIREHRQRLTRHNVARR